ncbi:MAG: hypothetical protein P8166_07915 [Candidatus Thiodiazotropha sp.]
MTTTLTPNLMTEDVNASIRFYCSYLGFSFQMGLPFGTETPVNEMSEDVPLQFAMLEREGAMLMFQHRRSLAEECGLFTEMPVAASATCYLEVSNLDELLAGLGGDVETVMPERVTFYGMREMWIRDNNGYIVTLAQKQV